MTPIIFHNPKCGTSRNTLAIMQASGETPDVVEYLKTPLSREYLVELLALMQSTPRELLPIKARRCADRLKKCLNYWKIRSVVSQKRMGKW